MAGFKIPLSRPAETTNPGFVYNPKRIALAPVEPGIAHSISVNELAQEWGSASRDYEALGDLARAAQFAEKAGDRARALKLIESAGPEAYTEFLRANALPQLAIAVCTEKLVADEWEPLDIELENQGFGPALNITIRLESQSIAGNPCAVPRLLPGEHVRASLTVLSTHTGSRVPFDLHIEYADGHGTPSRIEQAFHILVHKKPDTLIQNLGPVYNGPVDHSHGKVEPGGVKVEGDVGLIRQVETGPVAGAFQFCPYCGKKYSLPKTPLFCPHCGEQLQ
jgi:hypothetical protein